MIERKLKNHCWQFHEDTKNILIIDDKTEEFVELDKVRWFSLFRFMIRASQRMSAKRRIKK